MIHVFIEPSSDGRHCAKNIHTKLHVPPTKNVILISKVKHLRLREAKDLV